MRSAFSSKTLATAVTKENVLRIATLISIILISIIVFPFVCYVQGLAAVQPVHKSNFGFAKSKALSGLIGPVSRARVLDLWKDDQDGPPTPQQRVVAPMFAALTSDLSTLSLNLPTQVQQRGMPGTREILEHFIDGLEVSEKTPIYVVDLMLTRCSC